MKLDCRKWYFPSIALNLARPVATHRVKVYRLFEGLVVFKKYSLEALISSNREIQGVLDLFFLSIFPTFYS